MQQALHRSSFLGFAYSSALSKFALGGGFAPAPARSARMLWFFAGFIARGDQALQSGFAFLGEPTRHVFGHQHRARVTARSQPLYKVLMSMPPKNTRVVSLSHRRGLPCRTFSDLRGLRSGGPRMPFAEAST